MLDAVLAELLVKVGVREAALSPVLAGYDVAVARCEIRVPLTAGRARLVNLAVPDRAVRAAWPQPAFKVAGVPAAVRGDDHLDASGPRAGQQLADVLMQANGFGDLPQPRVDQAVLGEKVVVWVYEDECRLGGVVGDCHEQQSCWREPDTTVARMPLIAGFVPE